PEVVSELNVIPGAETEPEIAFKAAVMPAWPSRVRQSERPVAMSVKFWLTAADKIVVLGTNVFTIEKVPEPLNGMTILRAPIFQPFLLMGAHSSIPMLSDVAVATQELQSARESVVDDPAKKNVTNTNLFAVFGAVVILVINREKSGFIFPAAGTFCAIVIKDYFLKISVVPTMSRISITLFPLMFCLVISRKFH